jgi:ABC-type polysaccharide/polyol phosphate export permease
MKRALVTALEIYVGSLVILGISYHSLNRSIDWHHMFAYLTFVGLITLSFTGSKINSKKNGKYKDLHIVMGILTVLSFMATVLMHKYAIPQ